VDGRIQRLVGTKVDITERRLAAEAIRENQAALLVSSREIRHLAGSLITAQDAERARIARDLHDDVSQQLAALSIALSGLKRRVRAASNDGDLATDVVSIQERATALAESVRQLSHDLHPDVLKHGGLTAALSAYCAEVSRGQAVAVSCTTEGDVESIDSETGFCLYRIAQEALHNVVKHAGAHRAEIRLLRTGDSDELIVTDDGRGFDIAETRHNGKGLGLVSINERVRLAGGTLSVVTERRKGTQLHVRLPMHARVSADTGTMPGRYEAI
jgi:two-component system sensor histidine kinase UhpB